MRTRHITIFVAILIGICLRAPAAVYQYSVPMEPGTERRAYLWIPPNCRHVRGVFIGLQNMLEKPMFEDPDIRAAAADAGLAIVWISPGAIGSSGVTSVEQPALKFSPIAPAIAATQKILADLANESGYAEIEFAPLLPTGHSAASPFVWGMGNAQPDRVFALLPYKGTYDRRGPVNVPILHVSAEWLEWGATWGDTWHKDSASVLRTRSSSEQCMIGEFADIGAGHFDWVHDSAGPIGMFIRKAAQYRLPDEASTTGPTALKPLDPKSGVLVDPASLGTDQFKAVPYAQWAGDPKTGYWYFDEEMAKSINGYMAERLKKKPQMIDYVVDGKPAPLTAGGFVDMRPIKFLDDGVTFKVQATFLDQSPSPTLYNGQTLGHAPGPILFKVGSGDIKQVGPDTFRMWPAAGGISRAGPPWDPWVIAYQAGDAEYRSADRPAHTEVNMRNTEGKLQEITFDKIGDQPVGTQSVTLHATADSGLDVQLYVISGPVELDGDRLVFQPIPPRSRFPVRVLVGAYQWGRATSPKVQTAGPVIQEFFITK